jgi:hypothetical protein
MRHLGTPTRNTMRVPLRATQRFTLYLKTTSLQEVALYSISNRYVSSRPKAQPPIYRGTSTSCVTDKMKTSVKKSWPSAASRTHVARRRDRTVA